LLSEAVLPNGSRIFVGKKKKKKKKKVKVLQRNNIDFGINQPERSNNNINEYEE
jgi:hypothetical protein